MSEHAEVLERFRRGPELVAVAMTGAAGPEFDFVPAPGKWSVRQIICHLADSEVVSVGRFRRIIAEDNPSIAAYDQDAWARNLDYSRRKTSQAMETFRRMRAENHQLLNELPESAFERTGNHSERGTVTLGQLLEIYAQHAEKHAQQIQAVRTEFKRAKAGH